jgi:hypothetical protein
MAGLEKAVVTVADEAGFLRTKKLGTYYTSLHIAQ